jgi:hypothetical protein
VQQLKHWALTRNDNIPDEDGLAVVRLTRHIPDAKNGDDKRLQRILQHPTIPSQQVYDLLSLLLYRRGGSTSGTFSAADLDLLARAVKKFAHMYRHGLKLCMMVFTALFSDVGDDEDEMCFLLGGRDAIDCLLRLDEEGKRVALLMASRLQRRYGRLDGAGPVLSEIIGKIAEYLIDRGSLRHAIHLHEAVSSGELVSMSEASERFSVKGMDFLLLYRSIIADWERRKESDDENGDDLEVTNGDGE